VLEWADSYHFKAFKPKAANRRPLPVEVFAALISQCRTWARTDPQAIPATTQSGRGKREQARRKQRDGVQFEGILRLALNCALDPVDVERITWDALKLDARVPHMRFPRRKIEGMTGEALDRLTPLLPSTVDSLLRWREHEMPVGGQVFRTARKGRCGRNRVSATMKRLRDGASVDESWSFKHLRNVGATLGKRGRRSRDERDAFLGHVVDGTSKFYEGDVDETYLIPLVDLIGEQYFGGEHVKVS
jgi:integrase